MDNNFSDSEDENDNLIQRTLEIPVDESSEDEEYQQYIYSTINKTNNIDINSYDLSVNKSKEHISNKNNNDNNNNKNNKNISLNEFLKENKEEEKKPKKWMPSFLKNKSSIFTRKFNPRKPPRKRKEKINNKPTDQDQLIDENFPELNKIL